MIRDVRIDVAGCDDTTHVLLKSVSKKEQEFLLKLSKAITDASNFDCMPRMYTDLPDAGEYAIDPEYIPYSEYKEVTL